jgi:hypothetical protein
MNAPRHRNDGGSVSLRVQPAVNRRGRLQSRFRPANREARIRASTHDDDSTKTRSTGARSAAGLKAIYNAAGVFADGFE